MAEGNVGLSALKACTCMSLCPVHVGFSFQPVADMGQHYVGVLSELCNLLCHRPVFGQLKMPQQKNELCISVDLF